MKNLLKYLIIFILLLGSVIGLQAQQTNTLQGVNKGTFTQTTLVGDNTNSGTVWGTGNYIITSTNAQIILRDQTATPNYYLKGIWDSVIGCFKWVSGYYNGSSRLETSLIPSGITNFFGAASWFSINMTNATISASQPITFGTNLVVQGTITSSNLAVNTISNNAAASGQIIFSGAGVSQSGNTFTFSGGGGGGGETNTASNVGSGTGIFYQKSGLDLQFKSLVAGSGVTIADQGTSLLLAVSGNGQATSTNQTLANNGTFTMTNSAVSSGNAQAVVLARTTDTNTVLMLNLNGSNGSTNFTDSSVNAHTVLGNGGVQISTAQSKFGGASAYFDGSGDWLSSADSEDWNFTNTSWTVEMWIRPESTSTRQHLFGQHNWGDTASLAIEYNPTKITAYLHNQAISATQFDFNYTFSTNTWYHILIERDGNTVSGYVDGNFISSGSYSDTLSNVSKSLTIGADDGGDNANYQGYIDDIRVIKGKALYTTNFTAPTSELAAIQSYRYDVVPVYPYDTATNGFGVKMTSSQITFKNSTGSSGDFLLAVVPFQNGGASSTSIYASANGAGISSGYEVERGLVKLKLFKDFSLYNRTIATNDSEFNWTWDNRAEVTSANENNTVANACRFNASANISDWFAGPYTAARRYKNFTFSSKSLCTPKVLITRMSNNASTAYTGCGIQITDSADDANFLRYQIGYAAVAPKIISYLSTVPQETGCSAANLTDGIWLRITFFNGTAYLDYNLTVQATPPTTGWVRDRSVSFAFDITKTYQIGMIQLANAVSSGLQSNFLYYDDSGLNAESNDDSQNPTWCAQGYSYSSPVIGLVTNYSIGSSTNVVLASLKNALLDSVNTQIGDAGFWEFSCVLSTTNNAPMGSFTNISNLAVSGSGSLFNLWGRCTSTNGTQAGSLKPFTGLSSQ